MILIFGLNSHFMYLVNSQTKSNLSSSGRKSFLFDIEFYSSLDVYHPGIIWVVS
jgi:hypothetical protein